MPRWLLNALPWAVVLATWAVTLAELPSAADRVVVHWSLTGQPDGYMSKVPGLFGVPVVTLLVLLLLKLLPRLDPRGASYVEFASAYDIATLAIVTFLAAVQGLVLAWALGARLNVGLVLAPLVGALLIVLGAVIGEVRPNWFVGVRTPWTLSSDRSWTLTHRAARWVLVAMGVAIALAGVLQTSWAMYLAIALCVVGVLGLVTYSFVVWRADPERRGA